MSGSKIDGIHEVIRADLPFTWLNDGSSSDKQMLIDLLKSSKVMSDSLDSIPSSTKDIFEALEEWRTNIRNIVLSLENLGIDKYDKEAKKQSFKFVGRATDIFEGLEELGDRFDLSRTIINIRSELKMLDFDRNKLFNLLMMFAAKVSSSDGALPAKILNIKPTVRSSQSKHNDDERTTKKNEILPDESEYSGQWLNGEPDGQGVRVWRTREADSQIKPSKYRTYYEGDFQWGRAHGFGKCKFGNGDVYEGNWENDEKHGTGTQTNKKGIILSGTWHNGFLQGPGSEEWPNGDKYTGDFSLSKKHGNGKFTFNDGSCYSGEFKENSINGYGLYEWKDKRKYEGYFKNNKMEGFGKYTWPQGETYEGEYVNDKRHGKGRFEWPDGRIYEGYFDQGRKHGEAIYTDKNGEKKKGIWENGKHIKWIS